MESAPGSEHQALSTHRFRRRTLLRPDEDAVAVAGAEIEEQHGTDALQFVDVELQAIEIKPAAGNVYLLPAKSQHPEGQRHFHEPLVIRIPHEHPGHVGLFGRGRHRGKRADLTRMLLGVQLEYRLFVLELGVDFVEGAKGVRAGGLEGLHVTRDEVHARPGDGTLNTYDEWTGLLKSYEKALGKKALKRLHIHLSGIEYGLKGEKKHLALGESDLKLNFLFQALKDFNCAGRILCESPIMEEDALNMKKAWMKISCEKE